MLAGCASKPMIACGAGSNAGVMCVNPNPLLYATTTSNQVLPFSISNTNGGLTALTPAPGPANSNSIVNQGFVLMFADTSANQVVSDQVNGDGTLTAVSGSPFSLGSGSSGPTSIFSGLNGIFYASEPNGTIVGFSTPGNGTLTAPVPNSPFAAGTSPAQMAEAGFLGSSNGLGALYVSDAGSANGGILAYTVDGFGSLTPVAGSEFSIGPNSTSGSLLVSSPYLLSLVTSYAGAASVGQVAVFSIDLTTGTLTAVPGSPFSVGSSPSAIAVDSSNHLYVLSDHTVAAYSIGSNGVLTAIGNPVAAGTATGGIALYPPYLYAADTQAGSILIFNIDAATGSLSPAGSTPVSSPPLQLTVVNFPAV